MIIKLLKAEKMALTKTNLALLVKCKCGGTIAATMLWGGMPIDGEFMDTLAHRYNNGGSVEIINAEKTKAVIIGCKCEFEHKTITPAQK